MMNADQTSGPDELTACELADNTVVVPLMRKFVRMEKPLVETGRVWVRTTVNERSNVVEATPRQETLQVECVSIGPVGAEMSAVREEDGMMIIPVMEEVVVVGTRLVLKEEMHIRSSDGERHVRKIVRLRTEDAVIEQKPTGGPTDAVTGFERKEN